MEISVKRLSSNDRDGARRLFRMMAEIFSEECAPLSDGYVDQLLRRREFWALAAFVENDIVGGVTAHTLPMTRTESSEVFIYDIAVASEHRRKGVGRRLLRALCDQATELGIEQVFVPVDSGDLHALDFYRSLGGRPSPVTIFTFSQLNVGLPR